MGESINALKDLVVADCVKTLGSVHEFTSNRSAHPIEVDGDSTVAEKGQPI